MAKKTTTSTVRAHITKSKTKRKGIHSKKKTSSGKNSKHYKKSYRGQGR
jgi:hypothetical protein